MPAELVPELTDDPAFWLAQKRIIVPIVEPIFREIFIGGAEAGARETPRSKDIAFDAAAIDDAADEIIAAYTDEWWAQIEQTTRERLRAAIAEAREFGLGADWVADQIEDLFGPVRATRIAVSEVTNLLGKGAQETYKRAGFVGWIWRNTNDSAVDQICIDLSAASDPGLGGTPFPMSRVFARAHVNCRCWPVPAGDVVTISPAA